MEEVELFRSTWCAGNVKGESLIFECDMILSPLLENPSPRIRQNLQYRWTLYERKNYKEIKMLDGTCLSCNGDVQSYVFSST